MKKIREFFKIAKGHEIVRRYVIITSFDAALTILGIVMASFFAGISDPFHIILPSFGAIVALMVSGFWGAYTAETTETKRSIKSLEAHLMKKLSGTKFFEKEYQIVLIAAIVNSIMPVIVAILVLFPFFLVMTHEMEIISAYYASFGLMGAILFNLGIFSGRVSEESELKAGIKMLLAGIIIGVIFYFLAIAGLL